jgi:steroid delta-isomerase-like uncharacterized protein
VPGLIVTPLASGTLMRKMWLISCLRILPPFISFSRKKGKIMSETNKETARRIVDEVFSRGKVTLLESMIAEDVVIHDTDKELHGLEQLRKGVIALRAAFPDLTYRIEDLLADGEKVIARCVGEGTHIGVFRTIPPTGKRMSYRVIFIWRFAEDKLAEHWSVSDVYGMLQQLGVVTLNA